MRAAIAGLVGAMLIAPCASAQNIPDQSDLFHNPYNKYSAHHRPVGAGAEYGVPGTQGPGTRGRIAIVTKIGLSMAPATKKYIHLVHPTDPMRRITYDVKSGGKGGGKGLPINLRMPEGVPYPTKGEDRNVILWPRDGGSTDLCTMFYGFNNTTGTARYAKAWPFKGLDFADGSDSYDEGSGASRMRWPSGVMRGFEINPESPAPVRHCFQCTATRHSNPDNKNSPKAPASRHVLGKTYEWPAYGTDSSADAPGRNLGDIPYGTRLVIRVQDFDRRNTLGLSPRGLVLFDNFCYYGMYVVDGQGQYDAVNNGAVLQLRCDQEVSDSTTADVNAQLMRILPLLWPLRNPRPLDKETEVWTNGLPYAGGGGPIDPAKSLNTAWDAGG